MANMVTSIVMRLVDQVTRPVRGIQRSLSGLAQRAGLDRLGRAARQVGTQMGHAINQAKALGKQALVLGGLAAGAAWGIHRLVSGVTSASDEIRLSAQRLGVGTTALQEWMYVASQFGVSNDSLVRGMRTLQANTDEFIMTAKGPAADAFKRLGIDYKQIRATKGNADALYALVSSKLRDINNYAERQNLVDALFGGSGKELAGMVGASQAEIDEMKQAAHDLGAVFSPEQIAEGKRYNDAIDDMTRLVSGLRMTIVGGLLPAINDWLSRLGDLVKANKAAIGVRVREWLMQIWRALQLVGRAVSWVAERVGGFGNLLGGVAAVMATRLIVSILLVVASLLKLGYTAVVVGARLTASFLGGLLSVSRGLVGLAARAIPAAIAGIRALSLAFLTTPVGWIVTGIAAVAGAVYLIYRNWDSIAAWFGQLWQGIKAFFGRGIGDIAGDLLAFSPVGLIYNNWSAITAWFGNLWQGVRAFFSRSIGEIAQDLLAFNPAALLAKGIDAVFDLFGARPLTEIGGQWVGGLWDGISARWDQLTGWLRGKVAELTSWIPAWARDRLGIGGRAPGATAAPGLPPPAPSAPPVALGAPVGRGSGAMAAPVARADVGGELRIVIDSQGRPRVTEARRNGGLDFEVDSGSLGMVP
ncbi:hypothetical protein CSC67_06110 [Pusillimonas caeni]|uniref:hypothetical protein n=1 Tax=Pusillimonas caeni TaxID=1348472 RepID=UPI00107564BE|nr:hypothetical protein [Pusillimonas caeni]TFL14914.1 hypothetical protein CSC67_06110 [Pusillimonas caeni]